MVKKTKSEMATHEFFPRAKKDSTSTDKKDTSSFIFNKAPVNKLEAREKTKDLAESKKAKSNKRSAFMAKLYQDEDEMDEMRVLAGDQLASDSDIEVNVKSKKRQEKTIEKQFKTGESGTKPIVGSKIGKLKLAKGAIGMFAISEVHLPDYLIVNHTRNLKGYVSLKDVECANFSVGQMIVANVQGQGATASNGSTYNTETSSNLNRKLQLNLDQSQMYRSLTADSVTVGMILQARVISVEEKGFFLSLGFKDNTKAFIKSEDKNLLLINDIVMVCVKSVLKGSKMVKCELVTSGSKSAQSWTTTQAGQTIHHVKPGFSVSAKVTKVFENGLEVSFLGGMTGTIFVDHINKESVSSYKVGEKIQPRIISVDVATKMICLSLLPHITKFENANDKVAKKVSIGQVFNNVKVAKLSYGSSFIIELDKQLKGFLHKTHLKKKVEQEESDAEDSDVDAGKKSKKDKKDKKKKKSKKDEGELHVSQVLDKVKVKEINYFDGMPIVTFRQDLVDSQAITYDQIQVGDYVEATIEKVDEARKLVKVSLTDEFVKGILSIEHMADTPLKVIPPKFLKEGKQIKLRVFRVDAEQRQLLLTKKDTFFKEKTPVFKSESEVEKGTKVVSVVVGETDHGYVVLTFGGIKGLLTYTDINEHAKNNKYKDLKVGSIVKAYVLFKKKGQGLALTVSKKNARKGLKVQDSDEEENKKDTPKTFFDYLPDEDDCDDIKGTYKTMIKASKKEENVGKEFSFRVTEEKDLYYIVKSISQKGETSADKKDKVIIGILPKCLVSSTGQLSSLNENSQVVLKGLVLEIHVESQLPIVTVKPELIQLKDEIPNKELEEQRTFVGFVQEVSKEGVKVHGLNGFARNIAMKDLQRVFDSQQVYKVGNVLRVALNKLDRPCLKHTVLAAADPESAKRDANALITGFADQFVSTCDKGIKIGMKVEAEVLLVKDYGLILSVKQFPEYTCLIINEQKLTQKNYKKGQSLSCLVLDVDSDKKIIDLSEKLGHVDSEVSSKKLGNKVFVELVKEHYLVVTLKSNRTQVGVLIMNSFNRDAEGEVDSNIHEKFVAGQELEVTKEKTVHESGFMLLTSDQVTSPASKPASTAASTNPNKLQEGLKIQGVLKSVKGQFLFVQMPHAMGSGASKMPIIGRLHRVECQNHNEFSQYQVGDRIDAKILHIKEEDRKTWIELTRRKEHMQRAQGLDQDMLKRAPLNYEDLVDGQKYTALVTDVNMAYSSPISISISPFIRSQIMFNEICTVQELLDHGSKAILDRFKPGKVIEVTYNDGRFSVTDPSDLNAKSKNFSKGDLVIVRFVKTVRGRGLSVQLSSHKFAMIELCEITDEVTANMQLQWAEKMLFVARVIDQDAKNNMYVSSRESVLDTKMWKHISPSGKSVDFQQADEKNQKQGNMRNKLLKFGAKVALEQNSLAIGFVINIGKAGCFIQIGHNVTVRAGLNELSDQSDYDFAKEMPIGRVVIGRITGFNDDKSRFHFSLRESIVVYGVFATDRSELEVGSQQTVILMQYADGKAFGQIKGSYHKIKVKNCAQNEFQPGKHVLVQLTKVTKQKITGEFQGPVQDSGIDHEAQHAKTLFDSVVEEAVKDLANLAAQQAQSKDKEGAQDFDIAQLLANKQAESKGQDEVEQQMRDLNELQDAEDDEDDDEDMEDSDEEEMKRIISQSKTDIQDSDDDDDESGEDEDMDSEEGEQEMDEEDVDMRSMDDDLEEQGEEEIDEISDSSDEEESKQQKKSGKAGLKAQIQQEQLIRQKENAIRDNTLQPQSINDFEMLLQADKDQSYLWIQYMAFILEKLDVAASRRVAERAVKSVSISNDADKLNLWIAYMNMENNFGDQDTLQAVVKRALEVNDRKKIYLQLVNIYRTSSKYQYIEQIFKQLCKKYHTELDIWSDYLDFLFEMRELKKGKGSDKDTKFLVADMQFTEPKTILSKALQALPKNNHVNIISKFGMLEFKHGASESGRTMFEGIVNNYPKRMDIWSIYMDMEIKYGGGSKNAQQARHLFERCLANEFIQKKPKKMKLVFRKYMEYEQALGNQKNIEKLRQRVEEYLEKAFNKGSDNDSDDDQSEEEKMPVVKASKKVEVEEKSSEEDVDMESKSDDQDDEDDDDDDSMMDADEEGEDEDESGEDDLMDDDESSA